MQNKQLVSIVGGVAANPCAGNPLDRRYYIKTAAINSSSNVPFLSWYSVRSKDLVRVTCDIFDFGRTSMEDSFGDVSF